ncbi:MAG: hypothetical protein GVY30_01100 [Chloroflexi bacterium]|jgi:hypothetical protein|nr:hypothetical protein [Chloroflexota bacterium]
MAETVYFDLVSPERRLMSADVTEVRIPGAEGDLTAMAQHSPLITTLRPGLVKSVGPDGEAVMFAWTWRVETDVWASAIYGWRGEGEPKRLAMGSSPQWQLGAPSSP